MAININVTTTKVTITSIDTINKGEYNINDCIFTFSQEFANLTTRAVFSNGIDKTIVSEIDENNKCIIPEEILFLYGKCSLGVYGYENENNKLRLRYSPAPTSFKIDKGSYVADAETFIPAKPVQDLIDEYNRNAVEKTNEFNTNANQKTQSFNNNANQKTNQFNDNASNKTNQFNQNTVEKTNEFNQNVVDKTNAFNQHVIDKTTTFDEHVVSKTEDFDANAQDKTNTLNQIAEGIEDMTTAIQFATFEVDDDMGLYIVQADRLINTNFIFNPDTGGLEVMIV